MGGKYHPVFNEHSSIPGINADLLWSSSRGSPKTHAQLPSRPSDIFDKEEEGQISCKEALGAKWPMTIMV